MRRFLKVIDIGGPVEKCKLLPWESSAWNREAISKSALRVRAVADMYRDARQEFGARSGEGDGKTAACPTDPLARPEGSTLTHPEPVAEHITVA